MRNKSFLILILALLLGVAGVSAQDKAPEQRPKTISAGVVNGKAISLPKPIYPQPARAEKVGGQVQIRVVIDEGGNVISAEAVSGPPVLHAVAVDAALQAKFSPTTLQGQPVKVSGVIVYNFVTNSNVDEAPEPENVTWAVAMMLSFLQRADAELIKELGEEELDLILADMTAEIPPAFTAEKVLFEKMAKTSGTERQAAAGELAAALRKELSGAESWEFDLGEATGIVLLEFIKQAKNVAENKADETALRRNLRKIKDLLVSAPPEFSPELLAHFRKIAAFADQPDLKSPAVLGELHKTIEPLFDSVSGKK